MHREIAEDSGTSAFGRSRLRVSIEAALVGIIAFSAYAVFASQIALGWDEGFTFDRLHLLDRQLVEAARTGQYGKLLNRAEIARYWRFSKEEPDGHGPFYCLLSLASYRLTVGLAPPPLCYRLGSVALFAIAASCVFGTLRRRCDGVIAIATTMLWMTLPRVVPEVCFALIDGPLFSLAMLAWCAFVRAMAVQLDNSTDQVESVRWQRALPFGVCIGLAMATKVTGWLLPLPYVLWCIWRRRGFGVLLIGGLMAAIVCLAVNVGWWHDPIDGVLRFWRSNLTRENTTDIRIQFLGTRYAYALPWYNTLIWSLVANPIGVVILGTIGLFVAAKRCPSDGFGLLLALNWGLLMVVRAMPKAPGHDGTRQINIAFGFLALLAGYGMSIFLRDANGRFGKSLFVRLAMLAALCESAVSVVRNHPFELSYYSPAIGGLPGATKLGFEPTYFWDSLTDEALDWLNQNTPADGRVLFRNNPTSFDYLSQWGKLRVPHRPRLDTAPTFLVMQMRPGIFTPADDWLVSNCKPVFRVQHQGVTLLAIYPGEAFAKAQQAVRREPEHQP